MTTPTFRVASRRRPAISPVRTAGHPSWWTRQDAYEAAESATLLRLTFNLVVWYGVRVRSHRRITSH